MSAIEGNTDGAPKGRDWRLSDAGPECVAGSMMGRRPKAITNPVRLRASIFGPGLPRKPGPIGRIGSTFVKCQ
jgi:hypothetical protein